MKEAALSIIHALLINRQFENVNFANLNIPNAMPYQKREFKKVKFAHLNIPNEGNCIIFIPY
jgi:hypothetical protein